MNFMEREITLMPLRFVLCCCHDLAPKPLAGQYFFGLKILSAFYICCIYTGHLHFRLNFMMEVNIMNTDCDLGPYCLQEHKQRQTF